MRKFIGASGWISPHSFLPAILFLMSFVLLVMPAARGQVCVDVHLTDPLDQTISPVYWAPGQNYTVIFTDPNGRFFQGQSTALYVFNQSQYVPGFVYQEDPYVSHGLPVYIDAYHVAFSVSVAAGAPIENDGLTFACFQQGYVEGPGSIRVTPCATPVAPGPISIQPGTWVAGQQTAITITGTGFIPDNNPNGCQSTSLSITAGAEPVATQNITVVSSTQITATVQPDITDPAETATLTVSNYQYNNPSVPLTSSTTAQIVPTTCPLPTITAVSPNPWFTGRTYQPVTVTGTKFTTTGAATQICPATTLAVTTPSGANVALGKVTVNSSTSITIASVKPPTSEDYETATITAGGAGTFDIQIENPQPSITELKYTNSQPLWIDHAGDAAPVAQPQTVWPQSESSPSVFVSGNKINATATFDITPLTAALSGARFEGSVDGLGLLVASNVSIPAGAHSITVNLTGNTAFPPSTTAHYPELDVTWNFSPGGQACSTGRSVCEVAGYTSSEVYVTLAAPSGLSESVMPLTAVVLAIGDGGATTPAAAFQSTWQRFAGPANVIGWNRRLLYYYEKGVGFSSCARDSVELLTQPNGSGQCGSWARLFMDALAVNGISSSFATVKPVPGGADGEMLINKWGFSGTPTYPGNAPWIYQLVLGNEPGVAGGGMVTNPASGPVFGDLTSQTGLPGQNSATPSEKVFIQHFIVKAPSGLNVGGPYFDPSYGTTYADDCDFERQAVAGYAEPIPNQPDYYYVRPPFGGCSVTIIP